MAAVVRERDAFDDLADIDRMDDARHLRLHVDDIDRVDVAGAAALVADHRDIALRADLHRIRPDAAGQHPLGVLHLGAVDRQDRDLVVAVARHQRRLAVRRERGAARPRLRVAEIDLAGGGHGLAGDREDRHGAVAAVGDQRHVAGPVDRDAGRRGAGLQSGDHRRRIGLKVDHRDPVVGRELLRVGRVELHVGADQRQQLVGA